MRTDDELRARLRAAFSAATSADTVIWERTTRQRRVVPLDDADRIAGGGAVDEDSGPTEEVDVVLAKLSPDEMKVARCYAEMGLTWKQAALKTGQDEKMGEKVRRKLKREGNEYLSRRQ
ncbi:hypothetical protein [Streptomyces sp. P5_D11]